MTDRDERDKTSAGEKVAGKLTENFNHFDPHQTPRDGGGVEYEGVQ